MSDKTLLKLFQASSKQNKAKEKEVLEKAFDFMNKTEMGRQAIHDMSELDYTISFDASIKNANGFCDSENRQIVLGCLDFDHPEVIASTLVHETTHAKQADILDPDLYDYKNSDVLKYTRAIEADAVVHQVLHEQELSEQGYTIMTSYMAQHQAFEDKFEETHSKKAAMNAVFQSFYAESDRLNFYDNYYIDVLCDDNKPQTSTLSNKAILSCCKVNGKSYVDSNFLDSPQAFSLRAKDKSKVVKSAFKNAKKYGLKPDLSVMKMFTRTETGRLKTSEPIENSPARLLAAFKQNQR